MRAVLKSSDDSRVASREKIGREKMSRHAVVLGSALVAGVGAGAAVGMGVVAAAKGDVGGAPGISRALSRIGKIVGGGMLAGIGVTAAAAALTGLIVYEGLKEVEELATY